MVLIYKSHFKQIYFGMGGPNLHDCTFLSTCLPFQQIYTESEQLPKSFQDKRTLGY